MRIRKKWPPPPPPPTPPLSPSPLPSSFPTTERLADHPSGTATTVATCWEASQGVEVDIRSLVVEENKRIGWSGCSSILRRMEEARSSKDAVFVREREGHFMQQTRSQLETQQGTGEEQYIKNKSSVPSDSYQRNVTSSHIEISASYKLPSSSSHLAIENLEADKTMPLKKRKRKYQDREEENMTTKNCIQEEGASEYENNHSRKKKKKKKSNILIEGSRCSRVNGRGWRCQLSTFQGYALCPHHLEKIKANKGINSNGDYNLVTHDVSEKINDRVKQKRGSKAKEVINK